MSKAVMITGFSEQLVRACVHQAQRHGLGVVAALPTGFSLAEFADPSVTAITWTPRSAISAKSLILKVTNRIESLDEAIIAIEIPPGSQAFHEASYSDLDQMIDTFAKGPVFLVRELLATFVAQGRGGLTVLLRSSSFESSPMARALQAALESLFDSILTLYQRERVVLRCLLATSEEEDEIARAILDQVVNSNKASYKRFRRLGGRAGIFPGRKKTP